MAREAVGVGAVVGLSSWWILRRGREFGVSATVALLLTVLSGFVAHTLLPTPDMPTAPSGQPPEITRDGYVRAKACKSCHTEQHRSWANSYHSKMTQPANEKTIPARWEGEIPAGRFTATLLRKGDEFWVRTADLVEMFHTTRDYSTEPSFPMIERRIVLVTGSHHKQMYWFATGDHNELNSFPFLWLVKEKRWVPRDAAFMRPSFWPPRPEKGVWNDICITCHATGGRPRFADEHNKSPESDVVDFGISCEACHGPGEVHRQTAGNPAIRYQRHLGLAEADDIINPAKLSAERANETCGQCHSTWIFAQHDGWWENNRKGPLFKPGEDLDANLHPIDPREPRDSPRNKRLLNFNPGLFANDFWADGMIRVGGREHSAMLNTACYYRGKGTRQLRCTDCHQLHQDTDDKRPVSEWADDQLHDGMRGDKACRKCHAPLEYETEAHTHHKLESPGSRCMNCHMPHATYTLMKITRNHQVDIPSAATAIATGRPDACSLCHLDKPLSWTARHLHRWTGAPIPVLPAIHDRVPASVVWGLSGDALQRAIIAWNMGWAPAQQASGTDWLPLVLLQRLVDEYATVRFIAIQSLRTLAGHRQLELNYISARTDHRNVAKQLFSGFLQSARERGRSGGQDIYHDDRVRVRKKDYEGLMEQMDTRDVNLPE